MELGLLGRVGRLGWAPPTANNVGLIFNLPLNDAGAGAVNTTPAGSGGSAVATFTRATTAYTTLSTGLLAQVGSGVARSTYSADGLTYLGYLDEGARTNLPLWSRDLTNAAWVKTNCTAALTATGADGVANSATTLTATAGNATALQSITRTSAQRVTGCYIKRRTGSGIINMTQDNGATWTPVTVTAGFTQVAIPAATAANPTIGFQIVTNGDAIDVDFVMHEEAAFQSTPIPTTTASVTRNADSLTYPTAGNLIGATGSAYAEVASQSGQLPANQYYMRADSTGNNPIFYWNGGGLNLYPGATVAFTPTTAAQKIAGRWSAVTSGWRAFAGGVGGTAATNANPIGNGVGTNMEIGSSSNPHFGTIKNVKFWSQPLSDGQIQALTA